MASCLPSSEPTTVYERMPLQQYINVRHSGSICCLAMDYPATGVAIHSAVICARQVVPCGRPWAVPTCVDPADALMPASARPPHMCGGALSPLPPRLSNTQMHATYQSLSGLGVPASVALDAARRHPEDLGRAFEWACSSGSRHTRARVVEASPVRPALSLETPALTESRSPCSGRPLVNYVNIYFKGLRVLFAAPLPATGADLYSLASCFFPASTGRGTFHLRHESSGCLVADCPRHFALQSQDAFIVETSSLRPPWECCLLQRVSRILVCKSLFVF